MRKTSGRPTKLPSFLELSAVSRRSASSYKTAFGREVATLLELCMLNES